MHSDGKELGDIMFRAIVQTSGHCSKPFCITCCAQHISEMALAIDVGFGSVLWPIIFSLIAARTLYGAIWRLILSPIAQIPGPKFAALTFWNEFYYDVILGGQYTWKLEEYHRQYGRHRRLDNVKHERQRLQDLSYESILMKFTYAIHPFTTSFTSVQANERPTNGHGRSVLALIMAP